MRRELKTQLMVGMLALAAAGMVGCTSEQAPAPLTGEALVLNLAEQAKDQQWEEQYEALKDGEVTPAEHDDAFRRMTECMAESGITVTSPTINPADGLSLLYSIDGPTLDEDYFMEQQAACLESRWNLVDSGYLATRQPRMEPALMDAARKCLVAQGFKGTGNEISFRDLAGDPDTDGGAQRDAAGVCVSEQAHLLYPDLDQISVTM